jgi:hypothetical protein
MKSLWDQIVTDKSCHDQWDHASQLNGPTNGQLWVDDAIRKSYQKLASDLKPADAFQATRGFVDPSVAAIAADQYARAAIANYADPGPNPATDPLQSPMGEFFRQKYNVGGETILTGIPWLVLLEIVAQTSLVLRNCILNSLPAGVGDKIRKHPFFRFGFEYPLRVSYWTVQFMRQQPAFLLIMQSSFVAVLLTLTAIGWLWRNSLLFANHLPIWRNVFVFILGPVFGLYVLSRMTEAVGRRRVILLLCLLGVLVALALGVWVGVSVFTHA